jgi:hypothetical protein
MASYEVAIKRIVSPDGKVIAEAKSVAIVASEDGENQVNQSVSVNILTGSSSSSVVKSTSCKSSKSCL